LQALLHKINTSEETKSALKPDIITQSAQSSLLKTSDNPSKTKHSTSNTENSSHISNSEHGNLSQPRKDTPKNPPAPKSPSTARPAGKADSASTLAPRSAYKQESAAAPALWDRVEIDSTDVVDPARAASSKSQWPDIASSSSSSPLPLQTLPRSSDNRMVLD
jgi:hypothetical protein